MKASDLCKIQVIKKLIDTTSLIRNRVLALYAFKGYSLKRSRKMEETLQQPTKKTSKAVLKAIIFAAFIIGAIFFIRFTPVKNYLTAEALSRFLETAGLWAPVVYMMIYTVGVCLFLPGTLLTGLGAAIFGAYWGFLYVWIGAMFSASGAFFIGRTLGREFAASLIGDKLKKYDDAIERNGFATVLYLRLVYFPFTPMNFGMGLTKVRFWDYVTGTGLGIIVGTFIFTYLLVFHSQDHKKDKRREIEIKS